MPPVRCFLLVAVLWSSGLATAVAGISAPRSHATLSPDGKRLLVMISPVVRYDQEHPVSFSLPDGRTLILHEAFLKSGCYDVVTLSPIYQFDVFALKWNVRWTSDFTDVVILNQNGLDRGRSGVGPDWALAFYHEGFLVRQYRCSDLLTAFKHPLLFPISTWDYYIKWWDSFEVDGDHLVLSTARRQLYFEGVKLDLGWRETYIFDLATGAMISRSSAGAERLWAYAGIGISLFIVTSVLCWCFRRRDRTL